MSRAATVGLALAAMLVLVCVADAHLLHHPKRGPATLGSTLGLLQTKDKVYPGATVPVLTNAMEGIVANVREMLEQISPALNDMQRAECPVADLRAKLEAKDPEENRKGAEAFFGLCWPFALSALMQIDAVKGYTNEVVGKLNVLQQKFEEAQKELAERITERLVEADLPQDQLDEAVLEQLESLAALHVSFKDMLDSMTGAYREQFRREVDEGMKIESLYQTNFVANMADKSQFTLSMCESMGSLIRNWINNMGMGFRIYLKLFNKPRERMHDANPARFTVVDSNYQCEVEDKTGQSVRYGPFFYVIDGAPVDGTATAAERAVNSENQNLKLFMSMQPWVDLLKNDMNDAFVIAYGNTHSGKTHTLLEKDSSLVPKITSYLSASAEVESIELSAFEFLPGATSVKSVIKCLTCGGASSGKGVSGGAQYDDIKWLKADTTHHTHGPGYFGKAHGEKSLREISYVPYTMASFRAACAQRATRATKGNDVSSRSHAMFALKITLKSGSVRYLTLFDLAGLETTTDSGSGVETTWIKNSFRHFKMVFDSLLTHGATRLNTFIRGGMGNIPLSPSHLLAQFLNDRAVENVKAVKVAIVGTAGNDYDVDKTKKVLVNLQGWGKMAEESLKVEIQLRKAHQASQAAGNMDDIAAADAAANALAAAEESPVEESHEASPLYHESPLDESPEQAAARLDADAVRVAAPPAVPAAPVVDTAAKIEAEAARARLDAMHAAEADASTLDVNQVEDRARPDPAKDAEAMARALASGKTTIGDGSALVSATVAPAPPKPAVKEEETVKPIITGEEKPAAAEKQAEADALKEMGGAAL